MQEQDGYRLQAELLRVLAHPVRLYLLRILADQEACVCHLETLLQRPQPYVSKQLAALREAGLVTDRRDGTLVYYRIAAGPIAAWLEMGRTVLEDGNGNPIETPPPPVEPLPDCPCPRCQGKSTACK